MPSDLNHILADDALVTELMDHLGSSAGRSALDRAGVDPSSLRPAVESVAEGRESTLDPGYEAIIKKVGRPVLLIQDNAIEEPVLPLWQERLGGARANLERVIPSVGRIEVRGHPRHPWVGTGWIVAPNVIVTNRHVANAFGRLKDDAFAFRSDPVGKQMRARIDFYEEYDRPNESEFTVREILHIEDDEGPDMAFLRVASRDEDDNPLPEPVRLAASDPGADQVVGAIGYAAWDGMRNEREVMDEIFEGIYEVKRLHPGEVMAVHDDYLNHDCSTLGGNSGSAIIDFATGDALALHYAGRYEQQNYAVKASTLRSALEELGVVEPAA